jgi:hypothetical protein
MIRNIMLAAGLFTLTAGSAMAATTTPVVRTHHKVAQATDAPATGDAAKDAKAPKGKKSHKGGKKVKAEGAKADSAKGDMPAPAPATPTPAPAK